MKYVVSVIIALASFSAIAKSDWHILNLNNMACIKESKVNPYQAKQAGAEVNELTKGVFTISIGGNTMFVGESKAKCEEMKKALSKGK